MLDPHYENQAVLLVEGVDDPIGSAAGRPVPGKLTHQWFSDPLWFLEKRPRQELDDRGGHRFRETLK